MSKPSKRMCEFIEKIDKLCWIYGFEIWPTDDTKSITDSFGMMPTFTIHDMKTKEKLKLTRIDGDGGTCLDLNEIERIDE